MLTEKQKDYNMLRVNGLTDDTREAVQQLLSDLEYMRLYFLISPNPYRSIDDQNREYAKGRTAPGIPCNCGRQENPIGTCSKHPLGLTVTNAKGGDSWHNYGRAVDLILIRGGGEIVWTDTDTNSDGHADYSQMGQMAKNIGFKWGGDFSFRDLGHIEYHPGLTLEDMKEG